MHEDVVENGLPPQGALKELANSDKVSRRLGAAYRTTSAIYYRNMGKSNGDVMMKMDSLREQNQLLLKELGAAGEKSARANTRNLIYTTVLTVASTAASIMGTHYYDQHVAEKEKALAAQQAQSQAGASQNQDKKPDQNKELQNNPCLSCHPNRLSNYNLLKRSGVSALPNTQQGVSCFRPADPMLRRRPVARSQLHR